MSENEQFSALCNYVKESILKYNNTMRIPRYLVLRLKGLHEGKFIANNKQEATALYGYDVILKTFKYSAYDIHDYISKNGDKINDERHKINLIMTFVERNINTVVEKLKQKESREERIQNIDNSQLNAPKSNYVKKTDDKKFRKDLA